MRNSKKICLIIPCYNEEKRLDLTEFRKNNSEDLILVFVNDGSTDGTADVLKQYISDTWFLVNLESNLGKSEAIRQGALFIKKQGLDKRVDWFGFWDSDLSVPFEELHNFFKYAETFYSDAEVIIGSRVKRMGSDIVRSVTRHYLGRCFCTLVSYMFSISYYDTQCGAKLFRTELLDKGFVQPFLSNWIFDVELLLRLANAKIVEYPLQQWQEVGGSKIRFSKVIFEVISDLIRIKKRQS